MLGDVTRFPQRPLEEGRRLLIVLDDQHAHVWEISGRLAYTRQVRTHDSPG